MFKAIKPLLTYQNIKALPHTMAAYNYGFSHAVIMQLLLMFILFLYAVFQQRHLAIVKIFGLFYIYYGLLSVFIQTFIILIMGIVAIIVGSLQPGLFKQKLVIGFYYGLGAFSCAGIWVIVSFGLCFAGFFLFNIIR